MLKRANILLLTVLLAAFALGLLQLFQIRFEAGDVYPPYSSLRADPLGARAFYEALEDVRGVTVRRHYRDLTKLGEGRDHTIFFFGNALRQMHGLPEFQVEALEKFMRDGGRVVISFIPMNTAPASPFAKPPNAKKQKSDKQKDQDAEPLPKKRPEADDDEVMFRLVSVFERWNLRTAFENLPRDAEGKYGSVPATRAVDEEALPADVRWHTALYFAQPAAEWRTIYRWDERPVLIERPFGQGSLVLSADSYYLSNEALTRERQPELLAWLVGAHRHVIFDEAHLGVMEQPGIAGLVRNYRLHGVVLGFILLAGLFVWKNSVSLVPAYAEPRTEAGAIVEGKDSASGFINLFRRNVPAGELLSVCHAEWARSVPASQKHSGKAERVRAMVEQESAKTARERDPVGVYQQITQIIAERK